MKHKLGVLLEGKNVDIYVDAGGDYCPFCHSPEVEQRSLIYYDDETSSMYRDQGCITCGKSWTDVFRLSGVRLLPWDKQ